MRTALLGAALIAVAFFAAWIFSGTEEDRQAQPLEAILVSAPLAGQEGTENAEEAGEAAGEAARVQAWQMYVSLTEYGSRLACVDETGETVRFLDQGDMVWITAVEDGKAQLYTGKSGTNLYVDAGLLAQTQPGRLTRPIVEPSVPPEAAGEIAIRIWKERRDLELLNDGEVIATYSIGLGGWPWDTKIAQGDSRTPEGNYYVCVRNANSRFYLSLGLSYPNKEDAARGYENGVITRRQKNAIDAAIDAGEQPPWNTGLGGEIMIHGCSEDGIGAEFDWTAGCIAVDDAVMDILWRYCGIGTEVQINP